jgi:hypothetical protein
MDRGDKTAIELFPSSIRALALRSFLIDVVRTDAGSGWATSCVGGTTEARFAVAPMDDLVLDNRDLTEEEL